ncbi:MAG: transposase, partial [Wolbachia pipientis]
SERMIWKFLDDPKNIPLTNNFAERQIRHYVVYRKNSYFTQSKGVLNKLCQTEFLVQLNF